MNLEGKEWVCVGWIHLVQDRPVADSCEHGNETSDSTECWEFLKWLSNC
jgi:hypothetical protein